MKSDKDKKPQKPLSIEQAGNFLKEKDKTMRADAKKEAAKNPISVAPPKDRSAFLMYGISLLTSISETNKNKWCTVAGKQPSMYTTKEALKNLRAILILRINGYSIKEISHHLRVTEDIVLKSEALAIQTIREAISRVKATKVPIIGGK